MSNDRPEDPAAAPTYVGEPVPAELIAEDSSQVPAADDYVGEPPSATIRPVPPGPGLLESLAWVAGVLLAHVVGFSVATLVLLSQRGGDVTGGNPVDVVADMFESLKAADLLLLIGIEQAVFVAAAVLGFAIRSRASSRVGRLSFRPIRFGHLLVLFGLLLPVSVVATQLSAFAGMVQSGGAGDRPEEAIETVRVVAELAREVPLGLLVLVIAAAPAVGEEVVFRGLIGRGLVARWGLPAGVLVTSLLFAAVHLQPLHVISVIPLGVVIHLLYLATGSFWAPVLYHFLNNAMAAVLLKAVADAPPEAAARAGGVSGVVLAAALVCVLALLVVLWKSRLCYRLPGGSAWDPGYVTADAPPAEYGAVAQYGSANALDVAAAAGSFLLFLAALGQSAS